MDSYCKTCRWWDGTGKCTAPVPNWVHVLIFAAGSHGDSIAHKAEAGSGRNCPLHTSAATTYMHDDGNSRSYFSSEAKLQDHCGMRGTVHQLVALPAMPANAEVIGAKHSYATPPRITPTEGRE